MVNKWTSACVNGISDEPLGGEFSQTGVIVEMADDFSTQQPKTIDVTANRVGRKTR